MGGGCSTKRSIIINNASTKIESDKIKDEQISKNINKSEIKLELNKPRVSKNDEKKLKILVKQSANLDDFEESIEDLDQFDSKAKANTEKEYEQIWNAIIENDTDKLEKLLKGKEWPTSALFDKDKTNTMLHTAAGLGHVESLMIIIDHTDAKPDLLNANLATPLHFACRNNHEMVTRFLIGTGVDVNVQDEHGQTPILICCIHGHRRLAQILIESSISGHTPEPLDVDLSDNRGLTPLNCSAIKGNLDFCKLLLEKGCAKIDEPSPKGCTALLYAARGGFCDIVRYLLEKGANSLHQDNSGETIVHHAIEKNKLDILELLIKCSVDIDVADNAGRTPLFEAIESGNIKIAKLLINNGVRLNITDYSGHTPLYCASREGNEEIVKILIKESKIKVDHFSNSSTSKEFNDDIEYENEEEK